MPRQKGKKPSRGWPDDIMPHRPDRKKIEESLKKYIRVVRSELPPHLRPEFQLRPEDYERRIYSSFVGAVSRTALFA